MFFTECHYPYLLLLKIPQQWKITPAYCTSFSIVSCGAFNVHKASILQLWTHRNQLFIMFLYNSYLFTYVNTCQTMTFVVYDVCCLWRLLFMTFVALWRLLLMTFVVYDVCCLWRLLLLTLVALWRLLLMTFVALWSSI